MEHLPYITMGIKHGVIVFNSITYLILYLTQINNFTNHLKFKCLNVKVNYL